jgi:hypothetical protein
MNWNAMRLALAIPVSLLLSGCPSNPDEFSGETIVNRDGSVTRTTRFVTIYDSHVDDIKERYLLPSGGAWQTGKQTLTSENDPPREIDTMVFETVTHYGANEPIPSDFILPSSTSAKAARNDINVRVQSYWLVDTFQYEENFRDVVTEEGFSSAIRKFYTYLVESTGLGLSQIPHVEITAETAQVKLRSVFDPMIEQFLAIFVAECMNPGTTMGNCEEALDQSALFIEMDDDDLLIQRLAVTFPAPPDYQDDEWAAAISEVIEDSFDDEAFSILEAEEEELVGVVGLNFGPDTTFEIRLSLPGELVKNNAHDHESGRLVWRFNDEDFIYKEYSLHAQSRIIHYDRIVLLLIVLLIFLIIVRNIVGSE